MVATPQGTAGMIYSAYRQELGLVGGNYERGPNYDMRTWVRCANLVDEMSYDPAKFVRAQFEATSKNARRTLRPHHLFSNRQRAIRNYAKLVSGSGSVEKEQKPADHDALVRAHLASMESALSRLSRILVPDRFESIEDLLMEATMPFTAWFRVLSAACLTDKLAERYLEEARIQVTQDLPLRAMLEEDYVSGRYDTRRLLT